MTNAAVGGGGRGGLCVSGAAKKRGASGKNAKLARPRATPTSTEEASWPRPLRETAAGTDQFIANADIDLA